jgi:hypothetical protein
MAKKGHHPPRRGGAKKHGAKKHGAKKHGSRHKPKHR